MLGKGAQANEPTRRNTLRLWPGVVVVVLQWLIRFVVPAVVREAMAIGMIGGVLCGFAIVVWWAFFSRAHWTERLGAIVLMIVGLGATSRLIHVSIAAGAQGYLFPIYAIPVLSLAFVVWAVATRHMPDGLRRASMVATILLACGGWTLLRTGGISGDFRSAFHWPCGDTAMKFGFGSRIAVPVRAGHPPLARVAYTPSVHHGRSARPSTYACHL